MFQKIQLTIWILLGAVSVLFAQGELRNFGGFNAESTLPSNDSLNTEQRGLDKPIPSFIHSWELKNYGALMEETEVDRRLHPAGVRG